MRTVIVSGYFNPCHVGHLDYLEAARKLGDRLIVIVNNDEQVRLKGRIEFMPEVDRVRLVDALKCVDIAILSCDVDSSVCTSIERIVLLTQGANYDVDTQFVFANGGDQTAETIPESAVCERLGVEMVFGVGGGKVASSSELIERANERS